MKYEEDKVKKSLLKLCPKKVKYLGINLTEEMKDLYAENYKNIDKRN